MLHKSGCFGVFVLLVVTNAWSDEPSRGPAVIKQRVDPKVLREALALQEYQGKPAETPKVSLDDLQRLCDKLKKNGDNDGAELLQRFIHEHQQLVKLSARTSVPESQKLHLNLDVFEVKRNDLSPNSVLFESSTTPYSNEARAELDRLVAEKKVKKIIDGVSREIMVNEIVRYHSGGEIQVHLPKGDDTKESEFREFGTVIQLVPKIRTDERVQLALTCEISHIDPENAVTLQGTIVPGITKRKIHTTLDVNLGEATIISLVPTDGPGLLILTKVTKKN